MHLICKIFSMAMGVRRSPNMQDVVFITKQAILNNSLPQGTLLPTCKMIARCVKADYNAVKKAFVLLAKDNILIKVKGNDQESVEAVQSEEAVQPQKASQPKEPQVALQYRVALQLPEIAASKIQDVYKVQPKNHQTRLLFDLQSPNENDKFCRALEKLWQGHCKNAVPLVSGQPVGGIEDKLILGLREIVNRDLCASYSQAQLTYSFGYLPVIGQISKAFLKRHSFVMCTPASTDIQKVVRRAGKQVVVLNAASPNEMLKALELECETSSVGIFYLSSRISFPSGTSLNIQQIEQLLRLQEQYKFIIVEDDRYASIYPNTPNVFMGHIYQRKVAVIYLRPLTHVNEFLNTINIIAGPKKLICRLKSVMKDSNDKPRLVVLKALSDLVLSTSVSSYEKRINRAVKKINILTQQVLEESGLWKQEDINVKGGWYFFLRPKNGRLPTDFYQELASRHIYVIDPKQFDFPAYTEPGLIISIAGYLHDSSLRHDLEVLNSHLKEMIIN